MRTISKRQASDRVFMIGTRVEDTQLRLLADGRYSKVVELLKEAKNLILQAVREIDATKASRGEGT